MSLTDDAGVTPAPLDEHLVDDAGLPGTRIDVHLESGERYRVRATNADMVAFDLTAAKKRWPDGSKAPFLWTTFLAWRAAKRTGRTVLTFEAFQDAAADVSIVDEPEDVVPPSRPGAAPGSVSGSRS